MNSLIKVIMMAKPPTTEKIREDARKVEILMERLRVSVAQDGVTIKSLPFITEIKSVVREIDSDINYLLKKEKK